MTDQAPNKEPLESVNGALSERDRALGMDQPISRRDFVHDVLLGAAVLGAGGLSSASSESQASTPESGTDALVPPPQRTGLRGAHPGAFEVAHRLAREGETFAPATEAEEAYDLVVVGAGISGLAAAHYYRERFGEDARILLLDNHDDFGGHAKRNEFHQGGRRVLSLGGTHNLEWWDFSDTVHDFLETHGVDVDNLRAGMDFTYGRTGANSPALWFDRDTYGVDRLLPNCHIYQRMTPEQVAQIPISEDGRASLNRFYAMRKDVLPDLDDDEKLDHLRGLSYPDFLRRYGGLTEDAIALFAKQEHGSWGVELRALSAREALEGTAPGWHLLGGDWSDGEWNYPAAMWPDGNASLARLQVARLIPDVAPGVTPASIAVTDFDYAALDRPDQPTRLRLSATVVDVRERDGEVWATYINAGQQRGVRARHCVLACYHAIIPHLCPALPEPQRQAMQYQVKHPLLLTNVLIRNTEALDRLGIDAVNCPGRLHHSLFTFRGINNGGYQHPINDSGPVSLVFWGSVSPPPEAIDVHSQLRASRYRLLGLTFADFEREVREVLAGLLGPAGFDVQRDVLAITVNRWPHGYAYEYLDLWDPQWPPGEAPHEIARRPFGRITMANSDAAAHAYTHDAIDQAWRAVNELPD